MSKIGIGIIGCGDIARTRFLPAIDSSPAFELKGLHSRRAAGCEELAARYGGCCYGDLHALLSAADVDAVVVATPHPSHAELSIRCLGAGKHVLCEKPMATSIADANRICEAASRSDRVFMALPLNNSPAVEAAKTFIGAGAIGQVCAADAVLAHDGPSHAAWYFDRHTAGWGVLADLGIYLVAQLVYLLGTARAAVGRTETVYARRVLQSGAVVDASVEDNAAAVITWPNGVLATIRANWCSPGDRRNVICGTTIYGSSGLIFINPASETDSLVLHLPVKPIEGASRIEFNGMTDCYRAALPAWNQDRAIMDSFARSIARSALARTGASNALEQRHVIETIVKIYEFSAKQSGERI